MQISIFQITAMNFKEGEVLLPIPTVYTILIRQVLRRKETCKRSLRIVIIGVGDSENKQ